MAKQKLVLEKLPYDNEPRIRVRDEKKSLNQMLKDTKFVVEGEMYDAWAKWSKDSMFPGVEVPIEQWEQIGMGQAVTIGTFANEPVCISLSWALIHDQLIMFWDATSRVVHHGMIDEWLEKRCSPKWDKGRRLAHTNMSNFHDVYHYCLRPEQR